MTATGNLPSRRQWAVGAGFLACLVGALTLIGAVAGGPIALAALPGVAVGFVVTLQTRSVRIGALAVALMAGLALVSTLAATSAVTAGLWMAAVGAGYGLSGLIGRHRQVMQMAIWCAYIVVNPLQAAAPTKLTPIGDVDADLRAALVTAAAVLVAGLAMAVFAGRFRRRDPAAVLVPVPRSVAIAMAATLALLLGAGAAFVVSGDRIPAAEWLLLTVIVLVQPDARGTLRHTAERVAGTLGGVATAAVLALILGDSPLRTVLALALMAIAFGFLQVPGRYWTYVLCFTPGLVLLGAPPGQTFELALDRLVFTLTGAAAVALVVLGLSAIGRRSSA